jgi:hypothetical protein
MHLPGEIILKIEYLLLSCWLRLNIQFWGGLDFYVEIMLFGLSSTRKGNSSQSSCYNAISPTVKYRNRNDILLNFNALSPTMKHKQHRGQLN